MSSPSEFDVVLCPDCRAQNPPGMSRCWLCGTSLASAKAEVEVYMAEVVPPAPRISFTTMTLLVIVTLVAVALGLYQEAPGLAVLMLIVCLPGVIVAWAHDRIRRRRGERTTALKAFLDFVVSAAITMGILAMVVVAAVVAIFISCLNACKAMTGN
jgi:hypothetical protein